MKTKETSTRQQAIAWWNGLTKNQQYEFCLKQSNVDNLLVNRQLSSLTGREIEEIWRNETQHDKERAFVAQMFNSRPNQKQFKEFNESLFKAYIDKFSDEDKRKAFELIFDSIDNSNKTKFLLDSEIIDWYKRNMY